VFTPIAAEILRHRSHGLARSALPHAPVLPDRTPRRREPAGAARRRVADALRRSADVLAPSSQAR
jgi:hypothetical protein